MRVFVAGATGALGVPLVRRLIASGHDVTGLSRSSARTSAIVTFGATAVVADALDAEAVRTAVMSARPDVVVHALTAIPAGGPRRARDLERTNALRAIGTRHLLAAAIAAGARRIVVESMVFIYGFGDLGDALLSEDRLPAERASRPWLQVSIEALVSEERQVWNAAHAGRIEGIVLRFGGFYGRGAGTETMIRMLQRRALPVVRRAASRGVPWIHIEDAAAAATAALMRGSPAAAYNIVDDEAVPASQLIETLAEAVGAPRPWSIPAWAMRLAAPFAAAAWVDTTLKASNVKAKRELAWQLQFPTYREGIADLTRESNRGLYA